MPIELKRTKKIAIEVEMSYLMALNGKRMHVSSIFIILIGFGILHGKVAL